MRSLLVLSLAGISLLCGSATAAPKATLAPTQKYRTGVDFGIGIPTSDGYGTARVVVGVDFYLIHDEKFDLGASYTTSGKRIDNTHRWRANFLGGELNYKMPQVTPGFYLGAAAGVVSFDPGDAIAPGIDDLYFVPKAGLYRMISKEFSFGLESKLLFVTSSTVTAWLDLLGSVRFHF